MTRSPALTRLSKPLLNGDGSASGVTATWFTGPNGVVTNPGAPTLPLEIDDVTVSGKVLRGVGFRGGSFTDTPGVTPLTGAPATELNAPHSPFVSDGVLPVAAVERQLLRRRCGRVDEHQADAHARRSTARTRRAR